MKMNKVLFILMNETDELQRFHNSKKNCDLNYKKLKKLIR